MNEKIAKVLCDVNAVKFGSFNLASGRESPVYIDLRILPSYPESMKIVTEELVKIIKTLEVDVVAGAESAGIPLSTAVSMETSIPMIYVRRRPKGYGTDSMIEGILDKDQKVVLIDDLITNGGSKINFLEGIRQTGAKITDIVVVLDREQGGEEVLSNEGVKLYSLITLKELLDYMREHSLIEKEKYLEVLRYLDENA